MYHLHQSKCNIRFPPLKVYFPRFIFPSADCQTALTEVAHTDSNLCITGNFGPRAPEVSVKELLGHYRASAEDQWSEHAIQEVQGGYTEH